MADPWRILGLRPDTADEKQVRSAYSKLLKVHRPDQDPEGFQQLRTAYQQALEWVQRRADFDEWDDDDSEEEENEEPEDPPPVMPPPAPPATVVPTPANVQPPLPSSWAPGAVPVLPHKLGQESQTKPPLPKRPDRDWPREWSYSLESLDRALSKSQQPFDGVFFALKALAADVVEYGIPPGALECIISDAFHSNPGLFGTTAPVILLSRLLQGGCIGFLKAEMDAMEQAGNRMNLALLAQKLDECLADGVSPRTAEVFFRAATQVALDKPFIAQSIVRKLQRSLDAPTYLARFDRLHATITRGMALRDLSPEHRGFWSQRLDHPETPCDWTAGLPNQALKAVVMLGRNWVGCPVVQNVVPAEVWKAAWKGRLLKVSLRGLAKVFHPQNITVTGFAFLGGALLIFGAHLFTEVSPKQKPVTPVNIKVDPAEARRMEAFRQHLRELKEQVEKQQYEKDHPKAQ